MDGFESNVAVIVLGATNRPEILDQALLRPGRFDRRVAVPPPDKDGRRQILEVHTRSMPLGDDVDLDSLAASTPGMVGADLANLANEAALLAARRGHDQVQHADFTEALEKIILGAPRSMVLSDEDRRRTAYHESGHALVGMLTPGRGPGAQGLDHPARDGARRDALGARRREVQLRGALPAGQDQGRARRPRRGGGRLRDDHRRRGVRHPAADRDRAPDGRALGDERVRSGRSPCSRPTARARCCRASPRSRRPRRSSSTARCGGSSTPPTPRSRAC